MITRIFVYGTLLVGQPNHRVIKGATFVRAARTPPTFTMFSLDAYPGVSAGGTTAIEGEVFDVNEDVLERLDALEGHPTFYTRTEIELEDGERVGAYLLPAEVYADRKRIPDGNWRTFIAPRPRAEW